MHYSLHTICLEPARWTPKRVSQSLLDLLPGIAAAGFTQVEIYEPHLADPGDWAQIASLMRALNIAPVILSSYADLGPAGLSDEAAAEAFARIEELVRFFGFRAVRLFPAPRVDPADAASIQFFAERLRDVAGRLPAVEILLETHDGSVADDPQALVDLVKSVDLPNVGLLYQPTVFDDEQAQRQFEIQHRLVCHVHLQNRKSEGGFALLEKGVVRWENILIRLPHHVGVSIEFVPRGICPEDEFDLAAVLREAEAERRWVESIVGPD